MVEKANKKTTRIDIGLVGMRFNLSKQQISLLASEVSNASLPCKLVPESENEVDVNAIQVYVDNGFSSMDGIKLGYIPRPANSLLLKLVKRVQTVHVVWVDIQRKEAGLEIVVRRGKKK